MRSSSASKQVGVGVALVFSVTLVTFVFSFLGTILAAAVVGMMVGCARQWRWQFIPASFVFPAALMTSMHFSKSSVSMHESIPLSGVCFGVFWVTCLLARGLFLLEKRDGSVPAARAAARSALKQPGNVHAGTGARAAGVTHLTESPCDPCFDELQGTWLCETAAPDGKPCRKLIQVAQSELTLRLVDRAAKVRFLAKGDLTLEKIGAFKLAKVSHCETEVSGFSAQELGLPGKWLYRLVDDKLTVAVDFEETAATRKPVVETFVRQK